MIKIIDYKAGNAPSVMHTINRLGFDASFAKSADDLENAGHIILPGVGSAGATMKSLCEMNLMNALETAVLRKKVLFLGICVGMQILFEHSEEENTNCLGWLKGRVIKFGANLRIPQMGWNKVNFVKNALNPQDDFFYFVNSYYAKPDENSVVWGTADYGREFTAAVCKENIFATQFHIEKSGEAGMCLLKDFLTLKGGGKC